MKSWLGLLVFFLGNASEEGISWQSSIDLALKEAKLRNVPILVLISTDKDPECERAFQIYRSRKVYEFADQAIFVVGHKGLDHSSTTKNVEGKPVAICDIFGLPCEEHHKVFQPLVDKFATKEYWHPLQVFLLPDGSESYRFQKSQDAKYIVAEFERAIKKAGKGVSASEYQRIQSEIEKARKEHKDGKGEEAIKRLKSLLRKEYPDSMRAHLQAELARLEK